MAEGVCGVAIPWTLHSGRIRRSSAAPTLSRRQPPLLDAGAGVAGQSARAGPDRRTTTEPRCCPRWSQAPAGRLCEGSGHGGGNPPRGALSCSPMVADAVVGEFVGQVVDHRGRDAGRGVEGPGDPVDAGTGPDGPGGEGIELNPRVFGRVRPAGPASVDSVCFRPASERGLVLAVTFFSSVGLPMGMSQPSPSGRRASRAWSTGGGVEPVAVRCHRRSETGVSYAATVQAGRGGGPVQQRHQECPIAGREPARPDRLSVTETFRPVAGE